MQNTFSTQQRQQLTNVKRIVIKVGTHVLVSKTGKPNRIRIQNLVKDIAELHHAGKEIIFVSSGAVGVGLNALGFQRRPSTLPQLQMSAAVGQTVLMSLYQELFKQQKCKISQVLLTHDDLKNRVRHQNARNTMLTLLNHRVIPIVNENDVVAVDEIKVGDNDVLSALVSLLVDAQTLVLLTTPDGLRKSITPKRTQRVPYIQNITPEILALVTAKKQSLSTGGMATKLQAAKIVCDTGGYVVIASGQQKNIIKNIFSGNDIGTLIGGHEKHIPLAVSKRKRWIAFFHRPQGKIWVDAGAALALTAQNKSLLAIGITKVAGTFTSGAFIEILNPNDEIIAQGLTDYSNEQIELIKGQPTSKIATILGRKYYNAVIHKDNLVIRNNTL